MPLKHAYSDLLAQPPSWKLDYDGHLKLGQESKTGPRVWPDRVHGPSVNLAGCSHRPVSQALLVGAAWPGLGIHRSMEPILCLAASIWQDSHFDSHMKHSHSKPQMGYSVAFLLSFQQFLLLYQHLNLLHTLKGLTLTPGHCSSLPKSTSSFPPLYLLYLLLFSLQDTLQVDLVATLVVSL